MLTKILSLFSASKKKSRKFATAIQVEALTHTGLVRVNNEDSFLNLPDYQLWAVADGMGGYEGGEIASAIAVNSLKTAIAAGENLVSAILRSHHAIEKAAVAGLGSEGMGSTLVVMQRIGETYQVAWVGDSRAYLYRSGLKCLTKDHSYVQLLLDQGVISEADVENHPYRNVITQALGGIGKQISVDKIEGELRSGDIFLLCSDGLSGEVANETIEQILSAPTKTLSEKAQLLIQQALSAGGSDNITLILLAVNFD